ncbi:MAG: phosphatidylserine/phosphatidylglycerophosphate/cardiolipin synthase family protein [Clostridia bacterium]|nr:phosphatidylserine/phosphatidylglycerophosphate/cardiolipin synthase family protein [Clostridia bacterium]
MRNLFNRNFIYILLIAAEIAAIIFLCIWIPSYAPLAAVFAVIWVLNLIASVTVYCKGNAPEINCSLILMIIALPIAGAVIYLCSSLYTKDRGSLKIVGNEPQSGEENTVKALCGTGGAGYDRAVYLKSGNEFFNLLFKEIARARERIYLEYFIVRKGKTFDSLISAIRSAKRNGAEIKFLIDGIGSAFKLGRREKKTLKSAGAEVKIFHRLKPLFYTGLNNRDHRKIAAIDGKIAFTGGFNIGDEYANIDSPFGYWKDTGVAVYGAAAKIFEGMFLAVWNRGCEMQIEDKGEKRCIPYFDGPPKLSGVLEDIYMTAISSAKERVHIFTPYFCAGEKINAALSLAATRGVDVRIIIPHIPDKKYAFELSRTYASALIGSGIKVYEYTPGFMHAKSMVCDDRVYIGSYNLDFRSLRLNYECGVMFEGEICAAAERDFWDSMRLSMPFLPERVKPLRAVYRFFLRLFAPLF